ncbi:hypothetical protein B0H67DRAFT_642775 [Lasiosphaeris hirsuta]|uniref:Uncharacterized protein n=1 Tax=Lasiosphaeris hirsuta TaxID=260670 RepID=A0AA40DWY2_9PEZI|nr:hypothetical protein B0H67DRAFT_642775 [Lasiosphaeris hirsuta]
MASTADELYQHLDQYRPFNDFEVSGLLQMDLNFLRLYSEEVTIRDGVLESIHVLPAVLKIFATKKLSNQEIANLEAARDSANGKARRNDFYTEKRQKLDRNRYVITRTSDPDVYHIIPFAANSTKEARGRLENGIHSMAGLHIVETRAGQHSVTLDRRLRVLFSSEGKAYFSLKYLGTHDADSSNPNQIIALRIQWNWMVWRERDIGQKPAAPLERTTESIQTAFRPYYGHHSPLDRRPIVAISRPATGFNVESGDVFKVFVPKRHIQKMIIAFDLQ